MFKLQQRAIRIVANSKFLYNAHTEPLFKLFRILKLSDVLILQTMKVYHKFRNKELPVYMQNWPLIINNEIHQYKTRIARDLHTFRYHHTFAKKSLRHYLVQTINSTPDNVFSKFGTHSQGWIPRRVVSAYDVVNASYLPTTINIYDLEIRSINNYRKSYDIASFLVSTKISRRCRFGNSKPCKYIRSSYVRRNCIYDKNRVSANISSYDYR